MEVAPLPPTPSDSNPRDTTEQKTQSEVHPKSADILSLPLAVGY